MSVEVDRILSERAERAGRGGRQPMAASLAAALLLHGLAIAAALLLPRLQPPPKPLEFVPVTVIPAQALGVRRPAPPRRAPAPAESPAPEPPAPQQAPAEKPGPPAPKPKPRETAPSPEPEAPVLPEKTDRKKPPPKPAPPAPARPAAGRADSPPNATAAGETGDQAGRRGAPGGNPLGTTAFGSRIAGVDNPDFTYGYYLDRLLSLIDANWSRPSMGSGVRAIIAFRIQRDGTLSELRVQESSGYNSFDLAALRAVQNAAPFPPLPRAYRHDDLGVNLIVY